MIVQTHFLSGVGPKARFSSLQVRKIVKATLRSEKKNAAGEINVIFVNRNEIRRLNRRFLDVSGDTDVIAFPTQLGKGLRNKTMMGDVYICAPVARKNAARYGEPFEREITRLVVHGTLHLLGYADHPAAARKKMWSRQEPLVESLWTC